MVGIDFNIGLGLGALRIATGCDVEHGFAAPVGLVEIVGILAHCAVIADDALVVHAALVALIADAAGVVGILPDKLAPSVVSGVHVAPVLFVYAGLVLLVVYLVSHFGFKAVLTFRERKPVYRDL